MKQLTIGIDIGGTFTKIGLVDRNGQRLIKDRIETPTHGGAEMFVVDIRNSVDQLIKISEKEFGKVEIKGIGIGAPNGNYLKGTIEHAANLSFKGIVPFVEIMRKYFDYELISLTNDANAAAMGEKIFGGAKYMNDFILITLGTGLGSGVYSNGKLVYGHDGFAGELGHITVVPDGRQCGCGQKGHLETYCSATGIKRTALELLAHYNEKSFLDNYTIESLTSKIIFEAAEKGDKIALETFKVTGELLGRSFADFVHFSSPKAIFVFGGPTAAGEALFKPIRESFEKHLMKVFKGKINIMKSELPSGDAAILGASSLVWDELEN